MKPATSPRASSGRLLCVEPPGEDAGAGTFRDARMADLPSLLSPGDLLVVNDAATLPASFRLRNVDAEVRLVARGASDREWTALLLGAGDYRTPTELRPAPRAFDPGEFLSFDEELSAEIIAVDAESPRLVTIRFTLDGAPLFRAIYRLGRPIQYAYLQDLLALWDVQNHFAARPWALELPSAGRPLTFGLLSELRRRKVEIVHLTHAAGISSTGSESLDRRLPFPERYDLPARTADAVLTTRRRGGRVVAVGTTVVRALEANAAESSAADSREPALRAGQGEARLVIGPGFLPRVVTGVLSGMHVPTTSHFAVLGAFAPRSLLERALVHAERVGYLEHEFGDACVVLPPAGSSAQAH